MNRLMMSVGALALASFGCDSSSGGQAVTIEFAAKVGAEDFVCGDTYDNLGANDTSLQLSDFRLYVQDVRLKNADGNYVAVALTSGGNPWQTGNVTLLDFEDGCNDTGTSENEHGRHGDGPRREPTTESASQMGVPFELNHENPATADPPLRSEHAAVELAGRLQIPPAGLRQLQHDGLAHASREHGL